MCGEWEAGKGSGLERQAADTASLELLLARNSGSSGRSVVKVIEQTALEQRERLGTWLLAQRVMLPPAFGWPGGHAIDKTLGCGLFSLLHSLEFEVPCHPLFSRGSNSERPKRPPLFLSFNSKGPQRQSLLWKMGKRAQSEEKDRQNLSVAWGSFPAASIGILPQSPHPSTKVLRCRVSVSSQLFLLPRRLPESPWSAS